ncbi:hypothetical protein [Bradyrhizobium sp. LMG 9283]|uniref:hypothetical protein n=1 Tax=Bradyrhizobium sp. LMG 9283 TaxID=592064 RepID=UPI00389097A7
MARQNDIPSLPEAMTRLVHLGLASDAHHDQQQRRARKMAGDTIDGIGDASATVDDREDRKRDLLDGPEEFQRLRVDRIKGSKAIPD